MLLETAGPLLTQWEGMTSRLQEALTGVYRGPIRIGVGEGPVLYLLPGPLRDFQKEYPEIELVVRNQSSEDTIAMLRSGNLDFALRSLTTSPSGMDYRPTLIYDRVLIAKKGHPLLNRRSLTVQDLARCPFVMPWKRSKTRQLIERAFDEKGLQYRIALEAGGWEVMKRYVALGLGIAVVPSFCIEKSDQGRLASRSADHLFGKDSYGILTKRGVNLSLAAQSLIRILDPQHRLS